MPPGRRIHEESFFPWALRALLHIEQEGNEHEVVWFVAGLLEAVREALPEANEVVVRGTAPTISAALVRELRESLPRRMRNATRLSGP